MDLQIVTPSYDRPQNVRKILALLPSTIFIVNESQLEAYVQAGMPREQCITYPAQLRGIGMVRNWALDNVKANVVVQIDDDFDYLKVWSGHYYWDCYNPDSIRQVIESTAQVAIDAGISLFAWGNFGRPQYFAHHDPFDLVGPVSRAHGVVGRRLRWDEQLIGSADTDATLRALQTDRFVFLDTRFYFMCGHIMGNKGGLQSVRTSASRANDVAILKNRWGKFFRYESAKANRLPVNQVVVKRRQ